MTREELETMAEEQGTDLEALDAAMRQAAEKEPGSLERALLDSNLPETARLQVGCLIVSLIQLEGTLQRIQEKAGLLEEARFD